MHFLMLKCYLICRKGPITAAELNAVASDWDYDSLSIVTCVKLPGRLFITHLPSTTILPLFRYKIPINPITQLIL